MKQRLASTKSGVRKFAKTTVRKRDGGPFRENLIFEQAMFKKEKYWGVLVLLRVPITKQRATTGRRLIASCSRAQTTSASVCQRGIERVIDLYAR